MDPDVFPLGFWNGSIALRYTSYHVQNQPLSVTKIMPKEICSNGNRRPIRYENWNEAIAFRYDGNSIIFRTVRLQNFMTSCRVSFFFALTRYYKQYHQVHFSIILFGKMSSSESQSSSGKQFFSRICITFLESLFNSFDILRLLTFRNKS